MASALKIWIAAWLHALRTTWKKALKIDRSQLIISKALRSVTGFCLPLILGVATGHVPQGVAMAGGAGSLGAVGLRFTYQARLRTMLLASLGIAVSALVGGLTGDIVWLTIIVTGLWGVAAGLLVSISQPAMIVGLQSTIALIILSHFAAPPVQALAQAALLLAGALLQTGIALLPTPVALRLRPERAALAIVYQMLADYAENPGDFPVGGDMREALLKAEGALSDSNQRSPQVQVFNDLLEQAEHIRLELILIIRVRQQLQKEGDKYSGEIGQLDQLLSAASEILRELYHTLQDKQNQMELGREQAEIQNALSVLRQSALQQKRAIIKQVCLYGETLNNQLRNTRELIRTWQSASGQRLISEIVPKLRISEAQISISILRANLTLRSTALRHALRLGVTLAFATACYRLFAIERGYWIPLTVLLVLRPDFSETFSRGLARSIGTILGALFTSLIIAVHAPGYLELIVLSSLAALLAYATFSVSFTLFSAFITAEVILLLSFIDPHMYSNITGRVYDTIVGSVIALLAYALWPTWERSRVPDTLAERLAALKDYGNAVLAAYIRPTSYAADELYRDRQEARLARSNADASIQLSLSDPELYRTDADLARGVIDATDAIARGILTLDAYRVDAQPSQPLSVLESFAGQFDRALSSLVAALHKQGIERTSSEEFPHIERVQPASHSEYREAYPHLGLILAEANRIANGVNAISQLLATEQDPDEDEPRQATNTRI